MPIVNSLVRAKQTGLYSYSNYCTMPMTADSMDHTNELFTYTVYIGVHFYIQCL